VNDTPEDREAAWGSEGYTNRWFLDPVLRGRYPEAALCSAHEGTGIDELLGAIERELSHLKVEVSLNIPFERGDVVARVHEHGEVVEETYSERGTHLIARVRREEIAELRPFLAQAT
jgi:GTPase